MALSRERIADELLKLLALANPTPTVRLMLGCKLFEPVVPEIDSATRLGALVEAETQASIRPDPIRRLAALLPAEPDTVAKVAARLKLSNKAKKRLSSAADTALGHNPRSLAYRIGVEGAVDRLLLASRPGEAAAISTWTPPRLPIGGGDLIERGVPQGPDVASTLRRIEDSWEAQGFPTGAEFDRLVDEALR
jgi:poly(A) polymerase